MGHFSIKQYIKKKRLISYIIRMLREVNDCSAQLTQVNVYRRI